MRGRTSTPQSICGWRLRTDVCVMCALCDRILLQRIGKILTAPAHISVNKFAERNNNKHARILMARAAREASIQNKNEVFYSRLKSLKSYYNIEEWENDYKRLVELTQFWCELLVHVVTRVPHNHAWVRCMCERRKLCKNL